MKQVGKHIDETAASTVSYLSGDRSLCLWFPARQWASGQDGRVCAWPRSFEFPSPDKFPFVSCVLQWALVVCLHVLPARGEQRVHERGDRPAPAHLPDHRGAHPDGPVLPLALPRYPALRGWFSRTCCLFTLLVTFHAQPINHFCLKRLRIEESQCTHVVFWHGLSVNPMWMQILSLYDSGLLFIHTLATIYCFILKTSGEGVWKCSRNNEKL